MPKFRHIAIATQNPEATAEFYKKAFDFKEVGKVGSPIADGFYLSDGVINVAILRFKGTDQLGKGLDYVGIHHFGILVEDLDEWTKKLEELGADCFMKRPEGAAAVNSFFEVKFHGPDGVVFDVSEHPWPTEPSGLTKAREAEKQQAQAAK